MQVGAEPLLVGALEDLLDEQGYEIYIKRCDRYGMAPSNHISWGQVREDWRRLSRSLSCGSGCGGKC